ncbi:MAG: hypothetical protein QXK35_04805 [Nitrososphaerales archaeon]
MVITKMKSIALIITFTLISQLIPIGIASTSTWSYSERLNLTILGNDVFWEFVFTDGNVTSSLLSNVEKVPNILNFKLIMAKLEGWLPDYHLIHELKTDQLPPNGLILKVKSLSRISADKIASIIDVIFNVNLQLIESAINEYVFYSPIDFNTFVEKHLKLLLPKSLGGLSLLLSEKMLTSEKIGIITITANKSNTNFQYSISISSVKQNFIKDELDLSKLFPLYSKINASQFSNSSIIYIKVLGGFIDSASIGKVENNLQNFTSQLSLILQPNKSLPHLTIKIINDFPSLIAIRQIDKGSVNLNETIEVRIKLKNIAPPNAPPIENIRINEDWWLPYFEKIAGETSLTIPRIESGEEKIIAYMLRAISPLSITITQSSFKNLITYSYKIRDKIVNASTLLNQAEVSLNTLRSAIRIEAFTNLSSTPLASSLPINLTVINYGNRAAFNLKIYSDGILLSEINTLLPNQRWSITTNVSSKSLTNISLVKGWLVEWLSNEEVRKAESNTITFFNRLSKTNLPSLALSKSASTLNVNDKLFVNVTVKVNNIGRSDLKDIVVEDSIPIGLNYVNGSFIFANGRIQAKISELKVGESKIVNYLNEVVNKDENYVFPPAIANIKWFNSTFHYISTSSGLPLGISVEKFLSINEGFIGMNTSVLVKVTNKGSKPIFNLIIQEQRDSSLKPILDITKGNQSILASGETSQMNYIARMDRIGEFKTSSAIAQFIFAGMLQSKESNTPIVKIHKTPIVSLSFNPSQSLEGKDFEAILVVHNPSQLQVFNISVKTILPSSLKIIKGSLNLTHYSLKPNENITLKANLISYLANSYQISKPILTFIYEGQNLIGNSNEVKITIMEDLSNRYGIPIAIALLMSLVTVIIVRRITYST